MMISQVINDLALQTQNATNVASLPGSSDNKGIAFLDLLAALSSRQVADDKKPKPDDTLNAIIAGLMVMSDTMLANNSEMGMADLDNSALADVEFNADSGLSPGDGLLYGMIKAGDADLQGAIRSITAQQEGAIEDDISVSPAANEKQTDKPDDGSLYRLVQALGDSDAGVLYDIVNSLVGHHEGAAVEPMMDGAAAKLAALLWKANPPTFFELNEPGVRVATYGEQADKSGESNLDRLLQALEQKGVNIADVKPKLVMLSNTARAPAQLGSDVNESSQGLAASSDVISAKASHNITEPLSVTAEDNMKIKHDMNVGDVESAEHNQPDDRQLSDSTIGKVIDIAFNKANHAGMPSNDITGIDAQKMDVPLKDAAGTIIDELQRYLSANKQPASGGKMIFQLQPENMGRIAVEMQYADGRLSAHIIANTSAAYQIIDSSMNQLQQAVQRSGFDSTQLTLTLSQHNMQETWSNSGGWTERHQYSGSNYPESSVFNEPMHYSAEKLWDVWDEHSSINQYV